MTSAVTEITVETSGNGFYEFTAQAQDWLGETCPGRQGVLTLFVRHSSASLLIQENADPDVQRDLRGFLDRLVPPANHPSMSWLTHVLEGPDDMPSHIKAALLPTSISIPFEGGRMMLGTWQGLYLVEHRTAPHSRRVALAVS